MCCIDMANVVNRGTSEGSSRTPCEVRSISRHAGRLLPINHGRHVRHPRPVISFQGNPLILVLLILRGRRHLYHHVGAVHAYWQDCRGTSTHEVSGLRTMLIIDVGA